MSDKWSEQIFDSMLEEILGEQRPPDLTARIVDAWKRENSVAPVRVSVPETVKPHSSLGRSSNGAAFKVALAHPRTRKLHRRKTWLAPLLSVAASGLLVVASWQYWQHTAIRVAAEHASFEQAQRNAPIHNSPRVATSRAASNSDAGPKQAATIASSQPQTSKSAITPPDRLPTLPIEDLAQTPSKSLVVSNSSNAVPLTDKQIVELIDSQLGTLWKQLDITPTSALNRAELIRKTCQELTGPTALDEFARTQLANNRADQRLQMVQALIASPAFAQYWADRFASRWMVDTIAANSSTEAGKTLRSLLGREITQRSPWNKVIASLIHPEVLGSNSASISSEIFLTSLAGNGNHRMASRVGSNLLDQSVGCVRCHQMLVGPSGQTLQQEQFWSLVASLTGLAGRDSAGKQLRSLVDSQAELFANNSQANVFFELPDGRVQNALALLPNGQAWNSISTVKTPRQALANWLVESQHLDRAIVNQTWQFIFGRPLVPHVTLLDDVGLHEREELLHALALQLRANDHNLSKLVGWFVQSDAFTRRSLAVDRQKWLNANDADFEKWGTMESAFAAAGTFGNSAEAKSLDSSLAAVLIWNGMERAQDRSPSLAQPAPVGSEKKGAKKAAKKPAESSPSTAYLVHASCHTPAQRDYIRKVASSKKLSWRDQVQHVVGLTGDYVLTPSVEKLADQLLAESSQNVETALLQLLWAVRNSDAS